ncbi:MAG: hypothetical protein K0Q72_2263 [Armatimonadetes bacterium]|jgi:hypothetical protein|nr:hypothetical protein [Armatimonadota bacterium]
MAERPRKPTDEEAFHLHANFPNLNVAEVLISGEHDPSYNCLGWALGIKEVAGPWNKGRDVTQGDLDRAVADQGYVPDDREGLLAVWGISRNQILHVAVVLAEGKLESKLGPGLRIVHTLPDLQEKQYGHFLYYYRKVR